MDELRDFLTARKHHLKCLKLLIMDPLSACELWPYLHHFPELEQLYVATTSDSFNFIIFDDYFMRILNPNLRSLFVFHHHDETKYGKIDNFPYVEFI